MTDKECLRKHGCSLEQFRNIPIHAREAFSKQRSQARRRGVAWEFKLSDWWGCWQRSGKWEQRGRTMGCYVMCRKGDRGPYRTDNVYIATVSKNVFDGATIRFGRVYEEYASENEAA